LVHNVYLKFGINLDRTVKKLYENLNKIELKDLRKGDLLFFENKYKKISHIGIYIGELKFLHASDTKKRVIISDIFQDYYFKKLICAARVN
jgi:cell wall-associated NlpC family hydrolase